MKGYLKNRSFKHRLYRKTRLLQFKQCSRVTHRCDSEVEQNLFGWYHRLGAKSSPGPILICYYLIHRTSWWCHQKETFSAWLAICAGNSPVPMNSPHKGQSREALVFSLICVWINDWVNNGEASDLRRYRAHYDVIVMISTKFESKSNDLALPILAHDICLLHWEYFAYLNPNLCILLSGFCIKYGFVLYCK